MAIHETKRQSDLEKRLKILRQQIYGKEEKKLETRPTFSLQQASHISHPISNSQSLRTDISYLYHDLIKIGILATIALGVQLILFLTNLL